MCCQKWTKSVQIIKHYTYKCWLLQCIDWRRGLCVCFVRGRSEGKVFVSPHHPAADHGERPGLGRPQLRGKVPGWPLPTLWENERCAGGLPQSELHLSSLSFFSVNGLVSYVKLRRVRRISAFLTAFRMKRFWRSALRSICPGSERRSSAIKPWKFMPRRN